MSRTASAFYSDVTEITPAKNKRHIDKSKKNKIRNDHKMINTIKTNSENQDFQKLVKKLDADLRSRDGDDHSFYSQFNKIDKIKYAILTYEKEIPVGCGAMKEYSNGTMEIKRMYVSMNKRGQGIASLILKELELWAIDLQYNKCVLETGKRQPEAIALYKKNGYKIIPNFGQYEKVENSICFEKILIK